jgi:hypothetical protein
MKEGRTIETAASTFYFANLNNLSELKLSDAVFACSGMSEETQIFTANITFFHAELDSLETLNLSGAKFSAEGMTESGDVYTAKHTFENAELSSATKLILGEDDKTAVFASSNMSGTGDIYTASATFYETILSKIYPYDTDEKGIFGITGMTTGKSFIKDDTYKDTKFKTFGFNPIPVNTTFFKFENKNIDEQNTVQAIVGFSDAVTNKTQPLDNYDALDFSTQEGQQYYVSGDCLFNKNIVESWNVLEINFHGTTFLNNSNGATGGGLFNDYDLRSIVLMDLSDSV